MMKIGGVLELDSNNPKAMGFEFILLVNIGFKN